jgi:hypothetical protein
VDPARSYDEIGAADSSRATRRAWLRPAGSEIAHARCMWIRVRAADFPLDDVESFLTAVNCALEVVEPLNLLGYSGASLSHPEPMLVKGAEPDYPSAIGEAIDEIRHEGSELD